MSDIYVVVPKVTSGVQPNMPAHTTWQGAAMELAKIPVVYQDLVEVQNFELIEDE